MFTEIYVTVLYFASAKDATGCRKESFGLSEGGTIKDLLSKISKTHPKIIDVLKTMQFSVNYKVVDVNTLLKEGDEVALLPPISGG
jgi:molybdopterin converting factor subunit 1